MKAGPTPILDASIAEVSGSAPVAARRSRLATVARFVVVAPWLLCLLTFGCTAPDESARPPPDPGTADSSLDSLALEVVGASDARDDDTAHVGLPFWMPDPGGFKVFFIDVGQGDATIVIADDGTTMLVDGGRNSTLLATRLQSFQLKNIDVIVATHADSDHIGGLVAAFAAFDVKTVYWNGGKKETEVFNAFLNAATNEGAKLVTPRRGDSFKLGNLPVDVVHPAALSGNHNDDSIVLQTGCSGSWVLLTGDAEANAEKEMLTKFGISDIDVLKVGHHGSKSGTSQPFVDALKPKHGIISAGRDNAYGHPDAAVTGRLKKAGAEIIETDLDENDDTVMMTATCKLKYTFSRPFW